MTEPEPTHEAEPPHETTTDTQPVITDQPPPHDGEPPVLAEAPSRHGSGSLLAWLFGAGFIALAGAIGLAWWYPRSVVPPGAGAMHDLKQQVQVLETRLGQLERQPGGSADLQRLTDRVAALEKRPTADVAALEARLSRLEQKTPDTQGLATRIDALSGRLDALSGRDVGANTQLAQRLDANDARLSALEHNVMQTSAEAKQAARLARIQGAMVALNAGQPLGDIPGAPAAVGRFAAAAPPTEAALRLAFPKAERAALSASQPDTTGKPFLSQLITRAEGLVTVRRGDHVLIGDSAAGVLARARVALDAGDLAGAVAAVSALSGPAASAVANWRGDAQSLLDARAGLVTMAAHP
jgi:hypothetical protein